MLVSHHCIEKIPNLGIFPVFRALPKGFCGEKRALIGFARSKAMTVDWQGNSFNTLLPEKDSRRRWRSFIYVAREDGA